MIKRNIDNNNYCNNNNNNKEQSNAEANGKLNKMKIK